MKLSVPRPLLNITLIFGITLSVTAADLFTRSSGDWDSDIWTSSVDLPIEPGLRPGPSDKAYIYNTRTSIAVATPVIIAGFKFLADYTLLVVESASEFETDTYFGQGGKGSGMFRVDDGIVRVKGNQFILSGHIRGKDTGTGEFEQNGGVVEVLGNNGIELTGFTGDTNATGIYRLAGGVLNIAEAADSGAGISKGAGNGSFEWSGGTLNTASVSIGLANNGTGNLSPGGDGEIGMTYLASSSPQVYAQGVDARMTVDIVSKSQFDQLVWEASGESVVRFAPGTTIDVNLLKDYRPNRGDTFKIVSADQVIADGVKLAGPGAQRFQLKVEQTSISLVAQ